MKYVLAVLVLFGVLATDARAELPACKSQAAERDARVRCKKAAAQPRAVAPASGLTAADKEILDRAHTRTLLENIEGQLRSQRLGR
jgi:hypothetical protein